MIDSTTAIIVAALVSSVGALIGVLLGAFFARVQYRSRAAEEAKRQYDQQKKSLYLKFLRALVNVHPYLREGSDLDDEGQAICETLEDLFLEIHLIADDSVISDAALCMAMIRSHLPYYYHSWFAMGGQIGSKPAQLYEIKKARIPKIRSMRSELGQKPIDIPNPYMGENILQV